MLSGAGAGAKTSTAADHVMPPDTVNEYLFQPKDVGAFRALGRFHLLHELGSGPIATLFLAADEGELVALKRLRTDLAGHTGLLEDLRRDVEAAAAIEHPNVCRSTRLERLGVELFVVTEYVHGESLAALLRQLSLHGRRLPMEACAHLAGQACLGLQAAHTLPGGLIHGALSPHNLLVTYDGQVKIVDFGIEASAARVRRRTDGIPGERAAYLAPEELADEVVGPQADLFALGACLYEMLCGVRAFPGDSPTRVAQAVLAGDYAPARQHRPDLPNALEAIVRRALATSTDDRYPSAEAMYADLYAHLVHSPEGMTTAAIGGLMRDVFAHRYGQREQMRALAHQAPELLAGEIFEANPRVPTASTGVRCEFCGSRVDDDDALAAHLPDCGQRLWFEANFPQGMSAAGVPSVHDPARASQPGPAVARAATPADPTSSAGGVWGWLRGRFDAAGRDPLVLRLEAIDHKLASLESARARRQGERGLRAVWAIINQIYEGSAEAAALLGELKPDLVHCGEAILELAVRIDGNDRYLTALNEPRLRQDVARLRQGIARVPASDTGTRGMLQEMERALHSKQALLAEVKELARIQELLLVRLAGMVSNIEATRAKVLQLGGLGAFDQGEGERQVAVFVDALMLDVDNMVESVHEVEQALLD